MRALRERSSRLWAWLAANSEALKNLATAAALVGAGIWTIMVFDAELRAENARAQRAKLLREIESVSVDFEVAIEPLTDPSSAAPGCYLEIRVAADNSGAADLELHSPALQVSRVRGVEDDGTPILLSPPAAAAYVWRDRDGTVYRSTVETVRAGDRREIPFLVRVAPEGLYHASFAAQTRAPGADSEDGEQPAAERHWTATRYFFVGGSEGGRPCAVGPRPAEPATAPAPE